MTLVASTPIDDFLAGAGSSTATGERIQQLGLLGSLVGVTLAMGLIVFLALVHRGTAREVRLVLRATSIAGGVLLIGAAVEVAGIADVLDTGWSSALTDSAGSAAMMRVLAGFLIVLGWFDHLVAVGHQERSVLLEALPADHDAGTPGGRLVRWVPDAASAFGLGGLAIGVFSFGFDGHTVTQGPRLVHAAVNLVHVLAGSTWFGGIVGLVLVAVLRRRIDGGPVSPLVVRFSSVATVALVLVTLAGLGMALMIIDEPGDLTGTEWGRTLIIKTIAVGVAAAIGGYNHFRVVPALDADPDDVRAARMARTATTVEAIVLLFVVVATVFLVNATTN